MGSLRTLLAFISLLLGLVHSQVFGTPSQLPQTHVPVALTRAQVFAAVSRYTDWSATTMTQLSWCESRWEPWVQNPTAVMLGGKLVHSTGLLGVLGGSTDVRTNVAQAHSLWLVQGDRAWRLDFLSGCA